MVTPRPISELCRDLAASASRRQFDVLSMLLRMAAIEAKRSDVTYDGAPFVFAPANNKVEMKPRLLRQNEQRVSTRVGISGMLMAPFLKGGGADFHNMELYSDICTSVASSFDANRIDVALVLDVKDNRQKLANEIINEMPIDFAWVCAKNFKLPIDEPIPVAIWSADSFVLQALEDAGCNYRVVCSSADYRSKIAAVETGGCVAAMPRRAIGSPLVEVPPGNLPPIHTKKVLLGVRGGVVDVHSDPIVSRLRSMSLHSDGAMAPPHRLGQQNVHSI